MARIGVNVLDRSITPPLSERFLNMASDGFGAIVAAGIVGTIAWAFSKQLKQEGTAQKVVYTREPSQDNTKQALFGILFDALDSVSLPGLPGISPQDAPGFTASDPSYSEPTAPVSGGAGLSGLLNLIGGVEAPQGYDQVYGGIRSADQPPKPLTSMTVNEVLAWQDSIDARYPSEAAGRYQVMEDTLRGLVRSGQVSGNARFDRNTQDSIAVTLMKRRGLDDYQTGRISADKFAQKLSQEWASLPAITVDKKGRSATGQSYYAGDGLNRSHVAIDTILSAVRSI